MLVVYHFMSSWGALRSVLRPPSGPRLSGQEPLLYIVITTLFIFQMLFYVCAFWSYVDCIYKEHKGDNINKIFDAKKVFWYKYWSLDGRQTPLHLLMQHNLLLPIMSR